MKIFKIFKKKKKEIEHLRRVRAEWIENAAWHYAQGNCLACIQNTALAASTNHKIIQRRRRFF